MSKITLKEIIEYQKGAVFKSQDYQKQGVGIVRVSDFEGDSISLDNIYYISNEIADKNKKVRLKPYDVVITTVGATAGNFIRIPVEADGYLLNQNTVRLRTKENNKWDQIYLFYALKYKNFQEFLLLGAQGSAQPSIVLDQILDAEIAYPDNRREIAKKLFSMDQKIHLNTQINQTLEQIAQALFKSWFVDFEPVRAKIQVLSDGLSLEQAELAAMQAISGKTSEELTALSQTQPDRYAELAETAKAFPCEMVEVDGVEVPKEWEVKRIDEVIQKIPVGKKYSSKTAFSEGLVPILDQGRSGVIGYHNDKPGVKASIEDPIIVFANHTCYMRLISYDFSAIQNVFAFKGKECNLYWLYLATLGKQEFVEYKGHFPDFLIKEIIVPPEELTELFGKYVKESFSKIFINDRENSNLAKIRDLLLPKLLNGGIQNE